MSRITTPFNAQSTATEVIAGVDLKGKRAVVTGGASGIGLETARALAAAGAQVTLAVRNTDAGERAAPTASRRRRPSCSPSPWPRNGQPTASPPTRCTLAAS